MLSFFKVAVPMSSPPAIFLNTLYFLLMGVELSCHSFNLHPLMTSEVRYFHVYCAFVHLLQSMQINCFSNGLSFSYCSFYSGYKPFRSYKCSRIFPHSQLTFHSLSVLMNRNSYFIAGQIHWSFPSWFVLLTFHLNTVSSATSFSSSFPVLPL